MNIHPVANIYPELPATEFAWLVESIRRNGLRDPITTHDGAIVDGKHRYRACVEAGVEPRFVEWDQVGLLADFVHDKNGPGRRHLSKAQLIAVALRYKEAAEAEAAERSKQNLKRGPKGPIPPEFPDVPKLDHRGRTNERAAEIAGVSPSSIAAAAKLKKDDPAAFEAVVAGKQSLHGAVAQTKSRPAPPARDRNVIKDREGNEFDDPDAAALYLDSRDTFQGLVTELDRIAKRGEALGELKIGGFFRVDQFIAAVKEARRVAKFAIGHAACPLYPNCKRGCKHCQGLGYVTEEIWKLMPQEIKA